MSVKLLTANHLEFLSLKGGCTGSFESIHSKKVRKRAKIRNQYNQLPHLTLDNNGKVINTWVKVQNFQNPELLKIKT